jgi:site-specific DNA-methyltransferase (adenine-specific)
MPDKFSINHGDCLDILPKMPVGTQFDAVITDPPYMVGAISVGNSSAKAGTWADMENSAYWFAAWMKECRRVLSPTGYLVTFGNWRSIPTMIRALSLAELPASCCMVWDKQWIGPAGPQQLRPRYELAIFAAMPDAKIDDRSAPDIYGCKWLAGNMKTTEHPAEKPVDLMRHIVRLTTKPGATVLDPFAGSGTTGVACVAEGRRFVGIEREAEWVRVGIERCTTAATQGTERRYAGQRQR